MTDPASAEVWIMKGRALLEPLIVLQRTPKLAPA